MKKSTRPASAAKPAPVRAEWNSLQKDHDSFRLSDFEQIKRKISFISKHKVTADESLRKTAVSSKNPSSTVGLITPSKKKPTPPKTTNSAAKKSQGDSFASANAKGSVKSRPLPGKKALSTNKKHFDEYSYNSAKQSEVVSFDSGPFKKSPNPPLPPKKYSSIKQLIEHSDDCIKETRNLLERAKAFERDTRALLAATTYDREFDPPDEAQAELLRRADEQCRLNLETLNKAEKPQPNQVGSSSVLSQRERPCPNNFVLSQEDKRLLDFGTRSDEGENPRPPPSHFKAEIPQSPVLPSAELTLDNILSNFERMEQRIYQRPIVKESQMEESLSFLHSIISSTRKDIQNMQ